MGDACGGGGYRPYGGGAYGGERTKVVGTDLQSRSLCLEVEHTEGEHMEVLGMSTDRTDTDMAVEVPPEPEVQQGE
jgi:hypothetical protein